MEKFTCDARVVKYDSSLGLVMGWGLVCTEKGEPYFDLQGDHVPEQSMLEASADFMEHSRAAKAMHEGEPVGSVVFAWPMTSEIAQAFGLQTDRTGLMVAVRPDPETRKRFEDGTFTGFSIGGTRDRKHDEEVA